MGAVAHRADAASKAGESGNALDVKPPTDTPVLSGGDSQRAIAGKTGADSFSRATTMYTLPQTIDTTGITRERATRYACALWEEAVQAGWHFARFLDEAPRALGMTQHERMDWYNDIASQTNLTVKRIQNIVSLARNPAAQLANEMGLDISYGESIAGLPKEQAEHYLARVADGSITSVQQLRREVWAATTTTSPAPVPPASFARTAPQTVTIYPHDTPATVAARLQQTISRDFLDALAEALLSRKEPIDVNPP